MAVKRAFSKGKLRTPFWPATETGENVAGWPVRPRFYERSADTSMQSRAMRGYAARRGWTIALPLSQLAAIDPDESTKETLGDWHYWVSQGCIL